MTCRVCVGGFWIRQAWCEANNSPPDALRDCISLSLRSSSAAFLSSSSCLLNNSSWARTWSYTQTQGGYEQYFCLQAQQNITLGEATSKHTKGIFWRQLSEPITNIWGPISVWLTMQSCLFIAYLIWHVVRHCTFQYDYLHDNGLRLMYEYVKLYYHSRHLFFSPRWHFFDQKHSNQ